ncbi:MAG: L-2-hydroxyglutarate oxidase [Bacteroidota bacterium]
MNSHTPDIAVIGGGIVGLATARALQQMHPQKRIVLLEKEDRLGAHQSGRNSGVIHSGIYYRPGSLKAENCREGKRRLIEFCEREGVAYDVCGKVIVAVDEADLPGLDKIFERGMRNGIRCEMIGPERLRELEPHASGVRAIHVPEAGIVDFSGVCQRLGSLFSGEGGDIRLKAEVRGMEAVPGGLVLQTTAGDVHTRYAVNCAGLHSDRVAKMSGRTPRVRIVPFRGEYYELKPERRHLCRNLIYPVPDPAFPFLGVHFTRMVDGGVECGPSAILAFAREGYTFGTANLRDILEAATFPGLYRLVARHWRHGISEIMQSLSKRYYTRTLQRLIPEVCEDDLLPAPSGVRAQAIEPSGDLVDDFYFEETERVVNVCNAASPAATASLNVGELIARRLSVRFT